MVLGEKNSIIYSIGDGINIDSLTETNKVYYISGTNLNTPSGNIEYGYLECIESGNLADGRAITIQRWTNMNTKAVSVRTKVESTWSSWVQISQHSYLNSFSDLSSLASALGDGENIKFNGTGNLGWYLVISNSSDTGNISAFVSLQNYSNTIPTQLMISSSIYNGGTTYYLGIKKVSYDVNVNNNSAYSQSIKYKATDGTIKVWVYIGGVSTQNSIKVFASRGFASGFTLDTPPDDAIDFTAT